MPVLENSKHELFAQELAKGRRQLEAYRLAGYKGGEASACRLASNGKVSDRVAELKEAGAQKAELTVAGVLMQLWQVATADPRDLIEWRVGCCRFCWGKAFRRHETRGEREGRFRQWEKDRLAAVGKAIEVDFLDFDELGGTGFDATQPPNQACPECHGQGEGRAVMKDTSRLTPAAAALYAGVKVTKDGVEVRMHDKVGALTKVGQHLGMFVERKISTDVTLEDFLAQLDGSAGEPGAPEE